MRINTTLLLLPVSFFSAAVFLADPQPNTFPPLPKDGPATHNMLVVGERTVFLSHLPMFQEKGEPPMPHRYQAILEVGFEKAGASPQDAYFNDRKAHPATKIYTINPERFVLSDLVAASPLRRFPSTVFRGHLERPGNEKILTGISVAVKRVVHFREFDPAAKRPAQLQYILFGKGSELFLAHLIVGPPDFDQVLSVDITGRKFSDEELAKGLVLNFAGTTNTPATRLKEKQQQDGELKTSATAQKLKVLMKRELYFEEGELRVPALMDKPTPEEKKAGFL